MVTPGPVNVLVPWSAVAEAFGHSQPDQGLPLTTNCILCQSPRLRVYRDATGSDWACCAGCGFVGDVVALAAKAWGVAESPAANRLLASSESLSRYEYRQTWKARYDGLWANAQVYVRRAGAGIAGLRQRFRLGMHLTLERWRRGPQHLVGALPLRDVMDLMGRHRPPTAAEKRFGGAGWEDVLVLPYQDLPGRLAAFEFVGRRGDLGDRVLWKLRTSSHGELGLHGLDLASKSTVLGRAVVAVPCALLATRLQCRHLHVSHGPLPLVAWAEQDNNRTARAWQCLTDRDLVFWLPVLTPEGLHQAILAGGRVSTIGPPEVYKPEVFHRHLARESTVGILRRVIRASSPWVSVFDYWAESRGDVTVADLFEGLVRRGHQRDELLARLPGRLADRIRRLTRPPDCKVVYINRAVVTERADGWFANSDASRKRRGECRITNFRLRVDRQVLRGGVLHYRGRVLTERGEVPFAAPAGKTGWLKTIPGLRWSKGWTTRLLDLACRLEPPPAAVEEAHLGWDGIGVRLRRYRLLSGAWERCPDPLESGPGGDEPPNPPVLTIQASRIGPAAGCALGVLLEVLAPAFREVPRGVAMVGIEPDLAAELLKRLGCRVRYHNEEPGNTGWPELVLPRPKLRVRELHGWLNNTAMNGCLLALPTTHAMVGLANRGWHVLQVPEGGLPLNNVSTDKLVLAYLYDLLHHRMLALPGDTGRFFAGNLAADYQTWLHKLGAPADLFMAHPVVDGSVAHELRLARLVAFLHLAGSLVLRSEGHDRITTRTSVDRALARAGAPSLLPTSIDITSELRYSTYSLGKLH